MTHLPYINARGGVNAAPSAKDRFRIVAWTPVCPAKNTLTAFLDLALPSGLVLHSLTYHVHATAESRWVSMAAREIPARGAQKPTWVPFATFSDRAAKERFQQLALAAVDAYLAAGEVAR
ncbi:MAG: hypothetical protein ACLQU1_21685 [Bryobacteraceae bacterium]